MNIVTDAQPRVTSFEIKDIVKRCFEECEKIGYIVRILDGERVGKLVEHNYRIIMNEDEVALHIQKTLIGELLELEIIRKVGPALRAIRSVERDCDYLLNRQQAEANLQGLRIGEK